MWGIHRWSVNSPCKWPVTRKMFPFYDVIMYLAHSSSVIFILQHAAGFRCYLSSVPGHFTVYMTHKMTKPFRQVYTTSILDSQNTPLYYTIYLGAFVWYITWKAFRYQSRPSMPRNKCILHHSHTEARTCINVFKLNKIYDVYELGVYKQNYAVEIE